LYIHVFSGLKKKKEEEEEEEEEEKKKKKKKFLESTLKGDQKWVYPRPKQIGTQWTRQTA
jgi:hypothetical protein